MKKIVSILEYLWQLPQNICGIIWRDINSNTIIVEVGNEYASKIEAEVYLMKAKGGVTLGKYIFINQTYEDKKDVIKHECGHVLQSKMLGPLYLIIIGIPSIIWATLHSTFLSNINYYKFYTEKWANELAKKLI